MKQFVVKYFLVRLVLLRSTEDWLNINNTNELVVDY